MVAHAHIAKQNHTQISARFFVLFFNQEINDPGVTKKPLLPVTTH